MKIRLCIAIMMIVFTARSYAQVLAVNTNLLMDLALAPSVGMEIALARNKTLNLNVMYGSKVIGKDVNILAFQPECKFYLQKYPMTRAYIGAVALLTNYNYVLRSKQNDGNAAGAGLSFGYVWSVGERWSLDFHSSIGLLIYQQKEFFVGDNYDKYYTNREGYPVPNASGMRIIPMKIGASLLYIIK